MFRFVKNVFFLGLTILSNFANALDCISMKNKECETRPEVLNIISNYPIFNPSSIKINKCSGIVIILIIHMQKIVFLML